MRPCKQPMMTISGDDDHDDASSSLRPAKAAGLVVGTASFSDDEEELLIKLHALLGNRWSIIAGRLPGRTREEVKAHWAKLKHSDHANHRVLLQAPVSNGEQRQSEVQNKREDVGDASSDEDAVSDAGSNNI